MRASPASSAFDASPGRCCPNVASPRRRQVDDESATALVCGHPRRSRSHLRTVVTKWRQTMTTCSPIDLGIVHGSAGGLQRRSASCCNLTKSKRRSRLSFKVPKFIAASCVNVVMSSIKSLLCAWNAACKTSFGEQASPFARKDGREAASKPDNADNKLYLLIFKVFRGRIRCAHRKKTKVQVGRGSLHSVGTTFHEIRRRHAFSCLAVRMLGPTRAADGGGLSHM